MRSLIFLMSGEMLYYEDLKFFRAGRQPVRRYNTIHYFDNIFSWSSWGGHSHAQIYKFIFHVHRTDDRLCDRLMIWTHHPLIWMIIYSTMMYTGCFYIPEYIAALMDETRSRVFKTHSIFTRSTSRSMWKMFWSRTWKDIAWLPANDVSC